LHTLPKGLQELIFVSISSHQSGAATGAMLIPEQCWHQSNAGTRRVLAPGKRWHQGNAGTRKGLVPGKEYKVGRHRVKHMLGRKEYLAPVPVVGVP